VTVILVDGPLLQRASTVATIVRRETLSLSVPVSPGPFVQGATGMFAPNDYPWWPTHYSEAFADGQSTAHDHFSASA
jgi:hypothetical protein